MTTRWVAAPLAVAFATLGGTALTACATQRISREMSTVPAILSSSGSGAVIDGGNWVSVRDANEAPIANAYVTFDFTGTGMTPYARQPSGILPEPGFCDMLTVRTDDLGNVNFVPRMSGHENDTTIVVYARTELCEPGIVLRRVRGRSTDIVTTVARTSRWQSPEKTGLPDLVTFREAILRTQARECDFDRNGSVGVADWIIFAEEYRLGYAAPLCVP